jgi:hypothetical protein
MGASARLADRSLSGSRAADGRRSWPAWAASLWRWREFRAGGRVKCQTVRWRPSSAIGRSVAPRRPLKDAAERSVTSAPRLDRSGIITSLGPTPASRKVSGRSRALVSSRSRPLACGRGWIEASGRSSLKVWERQAPVRSQGAAAALPAQGVREALHADLSAIAVLQRPLSPGRTAVACVAGAAAVSSHRTGKDLPL